MEVANALAKKPARRYVTDYIRALEQSSDTTIVRLTTELLTRALDSYKQHHDKAWSLTDCLSFLVMQEHSLSEALTGDHHFEQAGFRPLFTGGSTP
jgi:predicted nucleic acid-binding protein